MAERPAGRLRRGWTTGACATAATRAAYAALLSGAFPDPVEIVLPRGQRVGFALDHERLGPGFAEAGVIKDAGDDPDVTHNALIVSTVREGTAGSGVAFRAGPGVGTVTKPGLPVPVGEPAVNPVPRTMMTGAVAALAREHGAPGDVEITLSVPGGERLAERTWNPRLGIVGGLSILGTTGVVIPYSCSAWIHSIHRGIDVARATGIAHVAGCTGTTSERAVQAHHALPDAAMIDMGDFAGGMLKYLRAHPVARVTIGGGFGKLAKLAAGHLDLHSGRSTVDLEALSDRVAACGGDAELASRSRAANTAAEVLALCDAAGVPIADDVARRAREAAIGVLRGGAGFDLDVLVVDRAGAIVGRAGG